MRYRATSRTSVISRQVAKTLSAIFAAVIISIFAAAPIVAQSSHGTAAIEGIVIGPDAKPVAGARVFLQPSDGRIPRVAQTDSDGHYRFHNLRQDFYDVRAQLNGRRSDWTRNVNLRSGAQVIVNLKLKPAPPAQPASTSPQTQNQK
jgi:protocatechuate 3,4-dioxygenase beta subunit